LVVDPHVQKAIRIESETGDDLGPVVLLNVDVNLHRTRQRPHAASPKSISTQKTHAVEGVHEQYTRAVNLEKRIREEN